MLANQNGFMSPAVGRPNAQAAQALYYSNLGNLSGLIKERAVSPVQVVETCLARIRKLNPRLNAFITILADEAIRQARLAESEIMAGHWRGPMHGIPVGIKDMYDTEGIKTTAAFEHFRDRVPTNDAIGVRRLKDAGAVIIGKTNMHKLAMGTTSLESHYGAVYNPWNREYIAGGSSGGSAAAVASGMCYATLDTDAIGSCRLPASCCGVTGFKGTYGLINNRGILEGEPVDNAVLWLAHAAITARTVEDAAIVLDVLGEPLPCAAQSRNYAAALAHSQLPRIGAVRNFSASSEVTAVFDQAVMKLLDYGTTVRDVEAPLNAPGFDVRNIERDRQSIAHSLFQEIDLLILPTTVAPTQTIEAASGNPQALSPQNTLFANYYGLPAVSVPCGFDNSGLPLGLQIVGAPGDDETVLRLAERYQSATGWAHMHPIE